MNRRLGFTLVELLVVIAIIGILISLLLPAVQAAREAARRMQCSNQIKQITLAILNYDNQLQRLPASGIVDDAARNGAYPVFQPRSGKMFSWVTLLLPFIEQQPLHDQFDFDIPVTEQRTNPQATHLPALKCPSDDAPASIFLHSDFSAGKPFAKGNYAAYCSPYHVDLQNWSPGALIGGREQGIDDILDGTSNTWVISEVRSREHEHDERGVWALPWTGASLLAFDAHDKKYGTNAPQRGEIGPYEIDDVSAGLTQLPNSKVLNGDTLYVCPQPAVAEFDGMKCAANLGYLSAAPRSRHPGGVFVSFLDGRVQFVPDSIDENVMAFSIAINDGRAVDQTSY